MKKYYHRKITHIEPGKSVYVAGRPATVVARQGGAYRVEFAGGETKIVHREHLKRRVNR